MDDFVPQFHGIEDEYEIPTSSSFSRPNNKHLQGEEDVMELMWQNGGLVAEKPSKIKRGEAGVNEIHSIVNEEQQQQQQHLFMQEDELASWLLDDRDLYGGSDLLYSAPTATSPPALRLPLPLPPPPPPPPPQLPVATNPPPIPPRPQNFGHFARISGRRLEPARDSTVDDANVNTLLTRPPCTIEVNTENGELDRKRKAREGDDKECQSQSTEDIEFEANEAKKPARSSASAKRTRASEVHNLSERRRRDRINEKMKALQELIPRCNKVDKASMLDEAIEYLKSLQMQVQMMSMGCGMVPMMYPGMHQYMPAMGMGMGMGMNRPLVPYPSMMQGSSVPNPAAPPHMGHTFPMPAFHLPPPRFPDPSRIQASNQTDPNLRPLIAHNPNQPRLPHFLDPYQQFLGHQQNQSDMQPSASAPSTSKETVNPEHRQNEYKEKLNPSLTPASHPNFCLVAYPSSQKC